MTVLSAHSFLISDDSIFGMLCIQVWTYYQRYPNDHWSYKVLVRACNLCFRKPDQLLTLSLFYLVARTKGLHTLVRPFPRGFPVS